MATTFTWELQGTTPTTIGGTDILRFSGAAFADSITVDSYNDSTHVKASGGSDLSSGNTPNNNKFISQTGGAGGDSQADWGDGTENIDQITDPEAALHIEVADSVSIVVEDILMYSYNGSNPATAAPDINVKLAEVGDTNFTNAVNSGTPLTINDSSTPATSHDFYIVISEGPTAVGLKPGTLRFEAVIQ